MDAGRAETLTARLLAEQDADGFFRSTVSGSGIDQPDANGFVTAQVLRALGDSAPGILGHHAFHAAIGALLACRDDTLAGFRFWPDGRRPGWAPRLPEDADDTAVMALALSRAGQMTEAELRRLACHTIVSHRLLAVLQPGPPWARVGAFKTWMRPGPDPDIADCTVNANAVGLLAAAGLFTVPGYAEACAMIRDAVAWAGDNETRAATLSPFYPEPGDLALAVRAAVAEGASDLSPVLDTLEGSAFWRRLEGRVSTAEPVVCGSPYGLIRWTSRAVGMARSRSLSTSGRSGRAPDPGGNGRRGLRCIPAPARC
jgi:hypothetical protein